MSLQCIEFARACLHDLVSRSIPVPTVLRIPGIRNVYVATAIEALRCHSTCNKTAAIPLWLGNQTASAPLTYDFLLTCRARLALDSARSRGNRNGISRFCKYLGSEVVAKCQQFGGRTWWSVQNGLQARRLYPLVYG